jgi:hypothetical protein
MIATMPPVSAQAPLTAASLKSALNGAAKISRQLDSVRKVDIALQEKATLLIHDFTDHNKEPCEYPQGQPELCADFDMERFMLNNRSADLQKEMKTSTARRRALQDDFALLMTLLRTTTWSPSVAKQKDAIIACASLDIVRDAIACLAKVPPPR